MDVSDIIARARRLTSTDSNQYSDADALEDLNFVYQDCVNEIVREVWEDYFWDTAKTSTVSDQSEYAIEAIIDGSDVYDIKKVKAVFIKWTSSDTKYTRLTYTDFEDYTNNRETLETTASTSTPFYCIKDESIFVFPAPTEVVSEWLQLEVIYTPLDLSSSWVEADIALTREYHYILTEGMKQYCYHASNKINEANNARELYEIEKRKMIEYLQERKAWDIYEEMPNITYLD